jgi:hypothetical protein
MTKKLETEATLERSLRAQVKAPRLDGRFDAAVWSRIEAEEQRVARPPRIAPVVPASERWLFIINTVGAVVALVLVVYFGMQAFGDSGVGVPTVPVPRVSASMLDQITRVAGWAVTSASLAFGLMFTSLGRRVRAELQQFL